MSLFYDFHIHSCLSPCADEDMTPYNLVNMAKLLGFDAIALTDHNSCLNCPAAVEAGSKAGITVIPGMELCTSEEVHVVCLFPSVDAALGFSDEIAKGLPPVKNRPEIFGTQLIMDSQDNVTGVQDILLTTASAVSITAVLPLVESFGGVCYPAHIDRASYSVLSNLGMITPEMGFNTAEVSFNGDKARLIEQHPILTKMRLLTSSDAHRLEDMLPPQLNLHTDNTVADIINYLKGSL